MSGDRVGFISDTHGRYVMTQRLVDMLVEFEVDTVVHLGDMDDEYVVEVFDCDQFEFKALYGNHDRPRKPIYEAVAEVGEHLGNESLLYFGNQQFFVFHGYSPERAEAVAEYPNGIRYVVHGHSHEARRVRTENGDVLCPGVASAWLYDTAEDIWSWVTLDEEAVMVERRVSED